MSDVQRPSMRMCNFFFKRKKVFRLRPMYFCKKQIVITVFDCSCELPRKSSPALIRGYKNKVYTNVGTRNAEFNNFIEADKL